ncbi:MULTISPECIES: NUDIX hydrolase [unclassified Streptomyces]|uniref:nucleotide triphosphate diphosphatase NUDT15 n=1 Tax=unclassified Streptomyces TaxID=2593676 RepID=UPI00278C7C13|nr:MULTISPECIES: NUDIX domain-containing protein [unclassified Streptomyces]
MTSGMTSGAPVVGVGALLLRPDGCVLIGLRVKRGEDASWCLPGGHVEPGESFEAAAVREIAEESGIREAAANARVFAFGLETGGRERTHLTAGVLVRTVADDPVATVTEPDVFERWIWAAPSDLPTPLFPASSALVAAHHGQPAPPGWELYPAAAPVAEVRR